MYNSKKIIGTQEQATTWIYKLKEVPELGRDIEPKVSECYRDRLFKRHCESFCKQNAFMQFYAYR